VGLRIKLSSVYPVSNSIPQAKFCQFLYQKLVPKPGPHRIPGTHPITSSATFERLYVFTKDLNQLKADLMRTDDEAAVNQRYKGVLFAKSEVHHEFSSVFGFRRTQYFGVCENVTKAENNGEAALTVARDRRIDQLIHSPLHHVLQFN